MLIVTFVSFISLMVSLLIDKKSSAVFNLFLLILVRLKFAVFHVCNIYSKAKGADVISQSSCIHSPYGDLV